MIGMVHEYGPGRCVGCGSFISGGTRCYSCLVRQKAPPAPDMPSDTASEARTNIRTLLAGGCLIGMLASGRGKAPYTDQLDECVALADRLMERMGL